MRGLIIHKFQIWKISPQIYVVHIFQKTLYKLSDIYVIFSAQKKKKKEKERVAYMLLIEYSRGLPYLGSNMLQQFGK